MHIDRTKAFCMALSWSEALSGWELFFKIMIYINFNLMLIFQAVSKQGLICLHFPPVRTPYRQSYAQIL